MRDRLKSQGLPTDADLGETCRFTDTGDIFLREVTTGTWVYIGNTQIVSKAHTQGTDQGLDTGGANASTASDVKDAVDKKHTQNTDTAFVQHSLATALNDVLMASGVGVFVKKTLAELKTALAIATDIATHAVLTASHGVAGTIAGLADIVGAIADHVAAVDPHTQYQKESEKGAASGYASLSSGVKVVEDPANATATPTASKIPIADGAGKVDGWVSASSTTVLGLAEAAIASEVNTGTDTARAVTPDALAGSIFGKRVAPIPLAAPDGAVTTGDGKAYWFVTEEFNGMNLVAVVAAVATVSSSGLPTYQIRRVRGGVPADMLSTKVSIDASESSSLTALTPAVIDAANDDLATGDFIYVDKDVAGTGEKGDEIVLTAQLP